MTPLNICLKGPQKKGLCQMLYKLLEWQRLWGWGSQWCQWLYIGRWPFFPVSLGVWGFSCVAVFAGAWLRGALLGAVWFSGCGWLRGVWDWLWFSREGRTAGGFDRYFSRRFCQYQQSFYFGRVSGHFPKSFGNSLGNSYIPCL